MRNILHAIDSWQVEENVTVRSYFPLKWEIKIVLSDFFKKNLFKTYFKTKENLFSFYVYVTELICHLLQGRSSKCNSRRGCLTAKFLGYYLWKAKYSWFVCNRISITGHFMMEFCKSYKISILFLLTAYQVTWFLGLMIMILIRRIIGNFGFVISLCICIGQSPY